MSIRPSRRLALAALAAGALVLSACSAGSLGTSDEEGTTTVSYLVDNEASTVKTAEALVSAFNAKNSSIQVKIETRPQGGEGDNIVKTRLATGDMADVFGYNSGSLFQALKPEQNLTPLDDQPYVGDLDPAFKVTVTAGGKLYGAPNGAAMGGGILYNKAVYTKLGLQVPKTWADFMANNAKIKAAGVAPVVQAYQDTWTSQVIVLADYHNVAADQPDFAEKFTANQAKFATTPAALRSFQRLQDVHDAKYLNKDFASAKLEQGLKLLADGKGAHFPMLTFTVATLAANSPDKIDDIGFFALPGDDAAKNGLTVWEPGGLYVPKSTTGAKLDAARQFITFVVSKEGCDIMAGASTPSGPFVVKGCDLPDTVPAAIKDMQPYFDSKATSPALEFLSPVKGPTLEQITVEVGSGIRKAADGAALYDQDVKKQAQQLGLSGW
ncbi:ABC transporter substrate-binding protein [Actinoplanes aureus]|uniref:Carbohydrate ABC transporter substrate-binding protein n=1 Tax=Actinoplanes aureus TaxID=2792083 RepID=A0A931G1A3_9ACTN|nr:ABC transporter substrate-binding protein [Actinoplanes aureus]MBG0566502.1 carbohydrate ABC transporter substrate-binding protein [Actinoplanes aureus]